MWSSLSVERNPTINNHAVINVLNALRDGIQTGPVNATTAIRRVTFRWYFRYLAKNTVLGNRVIDHLHAFYAINAIRAENSEAMNKLNKEIATLNDIIVQKDMQIAVYRGDSSI